MSNEASNVVDAILTAILRWRVAWLDEQKNNTQPPPICRAQLKKLKIQYEDYKDYESTFVPLLMHEIWAQIFEEWAKLEAELLGVAPMDVDEVATLNNSIISSLAPTSSAPRRNVPGCPRQFNVGVIEYSSESTFRFLVRCQYIVESSKVASHLKVIGEGDLIRLDLATVLDSEQMKANSTDYVIDPRKNIAILGLFAYVSDVNAERITQHTQLSDCFSTLPKLRNHHVVTYNVLIAKRQLKLVLNEPMRMSGLYYLKPMIRQIESVAILRESALSRDILCPRPITCQLTIPTVISMKSPHYNEMQYRAIIGANEAMVRSIPKIQLIQGPPGTGKTHTLVGIIKHFYMTWRDASTTPKILICAPSNGAIDEVSRRLHREREFSKTGPLRRSLRLVRVGNPDHINDSVKCMSLDELVEANAKVKIEGLKKRHSAQLREMEDELARCDTEIANLRYSNKEFKIPAVEIRLAQLLKDIEAKKAQEEISAKREVSEASKRNIRYELIRNADVILTTLNSCQKHPLDSLFKGDRAELSFHCVIVDEASQCVEPELLMPLCYRISRIILIGDPMQLPAIVISRHAQEFDFGRSLFERFFIHFGKYDVKSPIAMLTEQYRMHPEICSFPSKQFYDNRLVTARKITSRYPLKPYILFDLRHGSESKDYRSSLENEAEASLVRNLLMAVMTKAPEKSSIGVITPYKGQKRLITNKIANLQTQRSIKVDVNTCDGFQGQEKDIIILSCVRTFEARGSIGFLKSYQRVNVALTRAKHCLITCISAKSLTSDKTWQALITDSNDRGCTQILTHTPSAIALESMISSDLTHKTCQTRTKRICNSNVAGHENKTIYHVEPLPMDID